MPPQDEGITRDELKLMMEVQSKATEQMVLVADKLTEIVSAQRQALDNHNKILTELIGVKSSEASARDSATKVENIIDNMKNDITHAKWFIIIISCVIIVSTVILRGIDNRLLFTKTNEQNKETLKTEEGLVVQQNQKLLLEIKKALAEKDIIK
jgi:hypothetical protein